jgi:hypothetical protein
MPKRLHIFISYDVTLEYICAKTNMSQRIKKCKYNQEVIDMIFNLDKICDIYQTLWFHMIGINL